MEIDEIAMIAKIVMSVKFLLIRVMEIDGRDN